MTLDLLRTKTNRDMNYWLWFVVMLEWSIKISFWEFAAIFAITLICFVIVVLIYVLLLDFIFTASMYLGYGIVYGMFNPMKSIMALVVGLPLILYFEVLMTLLKRQPSHGSDGRHAQDIAQY